MLLKMINIFTFSCLRYNMYQYNVSQDKNNAKKILNKASSDTCSKFGNKISLSCCTEHLDLFYLHHGIHGKCALMTRQWEMKIYTYINSSEDGSLMFSLMSKKFPAAVKNDFCKSISYIFISH